MLNQEQLEKLNAVFQKEIKPIFADYPELIDEMMKKVRSEKSEQPPALLKADDATETGKTASQLEAENIELKACIRWMKDSYQQTLSGKGLRNVDEIFSYADSLIRTEENR